MLYDFFVSLQYIYITIIDYDANVFSRSSFGDDPADKQGIFEFT